MDMNMNMNESPAAPAARGPTAGRWVPQLGSARQTASLLHRPPPSPDLSTAAGAAGIGPLACRSCVGGPHLPCQDCPEPRPLDSGHSALGLAKRLKPLWAMTWILQRRS